MSKLYLRIDCKVANWMDQQISPSGAPSELTSDRVSTSDDILQTLDYRTSAGLEMTASLLSELRIGWLLSLMHCHLHFRIFYGAHRGSEVPEEHSQGIQDGTYQESWLLHQSFLEERMIMIHDHREALRIDSSNPDSLRTRLSEVGQCILAFA